jgi:hypothetical protein
LFKNTEVLSVNGRSSDNNGSKNNAKCRTHFADYQGSGYQMPALSNIGTPLFYEPHLLTYINKYFKRWNIWQ